MNATEVLAHHETALAAEQTWLTENQELLRFYHEFLDIYGRTYRALGSIQYGHVSHLRAPLPSHAIFENVLYTSTENDLWSGLSASIGDTLYEVTRQAISDLDMPRHTLALGSRLQVSCAAAERMFAAGIRQIDDETGEFLPGGREYVPQEILSVYHTASMEPLLLRKSYESTTALLLEPVYLDTGGNAEHVVIPRGTIAYVENGSDAQSLTGSTDGPNGEQLRTYEINPGRLLISPLRFSAWVHNRPVDRAMFSIINDAVVPALNTADWESYGDIEPKHIDQAAQRIMELCGVAA